MIGRFLLDTNIDIAFLGNDQSVVESTGRADEVYVSATFAGELYYGAVNSDKVDENLEQLNDFLDSISLLPCDAGTTERTRQFHQYFLRGRLAWSLGAAATSPNRRVGQQLRRARVKQGTLETASDDEVERILQLAQPISINTV